MYLKSYNVFFKYYWVYGIKISKVLIVCKMFKCIHFNDIIHLNVWLLKIPSAFPNSTLSEYVTFLITQKCPKVSFSQIPFTSLFPQLK